MVEGLVSEPGGVETAVERDLSGMGDLKDSALAATALALAREMDAKNSATSKSMCAKALNETMAMLRELAPPKREPDAIDDIAAQREKRRSSVGSSKAAALPRP